MRTDIQPEDSVVDIDSQLHAFWKLEHLSILDRQQRNVGDDTVIQNVRSMTKLEDGHVERLLLDLENRSALRDNKPVADQRLRTIAKKLLSDHAVMQEYGNTIRVYLYNGHAERVSDVETVSGPLYYIPHQAVFRRKRDTTKVSTAFDASSKASACVPLNETLHTWPNLNPDVLELLLLFRTYRTALTTDMEKALSQIVLDKSNRDSLRFLWYAMTTIAGEPLPSIPSMVDDPRTSRRKIHPFPPGRNHTAPLPNCSRAVKQKRRQPYTLHY